MNGTFITFEGGEGCGKTTQANLLYDFLVSKGYKCEITHDPGGTDLSQKIRKEFLLNKNSGVSEKMEFFLYLAARTDLVEKKILPALNDEKIVVCDRFNDSTIAYQGYGTGINLDLIERVNRFASSSLEPGLTLLIDIDAELGLKKAREKKGLDDRIESRKLEYHKWVNDGFRKIAKRDSYRVKIIEYIDGGIDRMQEIIREHVSKVINITSRREV